MHNETCFRLDIQLTPEQNPHGTSDRLREELRSWIVAHGLGYLLGALGGGAHIYGQIGPNPNATQADRDSLAEWLRHQRMSATVRLSSVATFSAESDLLAPITDLVFSVDNLSEEERTRAREFHTVLRKRVESLRRNNLTSLS
jgi:hypothetical protein